MFVAGAAGAATAVAATVWLMRRGAYGRRALEEPTHEHAAGKEEDGGAESPDVPAVPAPVAATGVPDRAAEDGDDERDEAPAARPAFDYEAFAERILATDDPIGELKLTVGRLRTAEAAGALLSALERFLAEQLADAGLFQKSPALPSLKIVRPRRSGMLYLRVNSEKLPYLSLLRVLSLERALNAVRFAHEYYPQPQGLTVDDLYRLQGELAASICGQAEALDEPFELADGDQADGEWAVRRCIAEALEALQLPHRLQADFRVSVADGNVAFELELPPEQVWPQRAYVEGLGTVPTTRDMRHRMASSYALRLALLVASIAFRASQKVKHVWVAGFVKTANRHACYLSVDFDRWRFGRLDLHRLPALDVAYCSFVPQMRYEEQILRPVEQGFSLSEQRFCPPRRYEAVSLSARRIPRAQAQVLGVDHVYGLAIEEAYKRSALAGDIVRRLVPPSDEHATQKNVRMILDLVGNDPDPTVRAASERLVKGLIEGAVEPDAQSIAQEFVAGDTLSVAAFGARALAKQKDYPAAERVLQEALAAADARGDYLDTPTVEWRYFNNYVDRALYNSLFAAAGVSVMLVPDMYFECHFLLAQLSLALGKHEQALRSAERLFALAPLDKRAHLSLVHCLAEAGHAERAREELTHFIARAHDPQGLAMGYYQLAHLEQEAGRLVSAEACYLCAINFMPLAAPMVSLEMAALALQSPGTLHEDLSTEEVVSVLEDNGIPVGPSEDVSTAFYNCARASLDAEVFPVARSFMGLLSAFSGDDVILSMLRSLESEPDA